MIICAKLNLHKRPCRLSFICIHVAILNARHQVKLIASADAIVYRWWSQTGYELDWNVRLPFDANDQHNNHIFLFRRENFDWHWFNCVYNFIFGFSRYKIYQQLFFIILQYNSINEIAINFRNNLCPRCNFCKQIIMKAVKKL